MANTQTIAASGIPLALVQWIDKQAKQQCTNRSTIIRQILTQRAAEDEINGLSGDQKEVA
jgi:metal-responsive CopG/Arc/MetJ family transcriptional regulator